MKYVAIVPKPRTPVKSSEDWQQQPPVAAATTVYETEEGPVRTGLLDAQGVPLYRVRDRIGFLP